MGAMHNREQRSLCIGIAECAQIEFSLSGRFGADGGEPFAARGGILKAVCAHSCIEIAGVRKAEFLFEAGPQSGYFTLENVVIGKGFHWQRSQRQSFKGSLRLIAREGRLIVINIIGIEDYLQSVIASEMSPASGVEFLKAHAVISRSWLLSQLDKRSAVAGSYSAVECDTPQCLIRWQDREDHPYYDFCADDHCQRYQGIPQAARQMQGAPGPQNDSQMQGAGIRQGAAAGSSGAGSSWAGASEAGASGAGSSVAGGAMADEAMIAKTRAVIEATWGEVLCYGGRVCDARFSKCCGGATEEFGYCWEQKQVPYLKYLRDYSGGPKSDLRLESEARRWIMSHPRAFCNTRSKRLLSQVLKSYDSTTQDFYRWSVEYSQSEIAEIICSRTGVDFGPIVDLVPLERGVSGRISRLKIVGVKAQKIIGKELEIRKALSRSHLYSSAFVVERLMDAGESLPRRFVLHGAGWGHGVGLCQIGAAAMGSRGYGYREILAHYYPGAEIITTDTL